MNNTMLPSTRAMRQRRKLLPSLPNDIGQGLQDARLDAFCRMVSDGMAIGEAGEASGLRINPWKAMRQPRVIERVHAILRARAEASAATLPEITDMLRRLFAAAYHAADYGPAHNAALSLAKLYGLIIDRAQVDVVRRPSRDPDGPSEVALEAWAASLPGIPSNILDLAPNPQGPGPGQGLGPQGPSLDKSLITLDNSGPLGPDGIVFAPPGDGLANFPNEIKHLAGARPVAGGTENGAPEAGVTGTPHPRARARIHAADKAPGPPGARQKRVPRKRKRVPLKRGAKKPPVPKTKIPSAKELFG